MQKKNFKKNVYICIGESLCYTAEINYIITEYIYIYIYITEINNIINHLYLNLKK